MALIYQISLHGSAYDAREKEWDEMIAETGKEPDRNWKNPDMDGRPLLKGEYGCAISHLRVWQKIVDSGLNGIILEEDAVFDEINPYHVDHLLEDHDSVWLGYRWNTFGTWYNCHGYCLTPDTAKRLVDNFDKIIAVDEYVTQQLQGMRNYFYPEQVVNQIPRETRPSTIEETEMLPEDVNFHIVTVATNEDKMWALQKTAERYNVTVHNLGKDSDWYDPMEGHAGMPKIDMMIEFLKELPIADVVLFMDGYDTFFADDPLTILERWYDFGVDILFSAEDTFWPPEEFLQKQFERHHPDTVYPYLNSGLYMGRADALYHFLTENVAGDGDDDQRYCQIRYLARTPPPEDAPIQWKWERLNVPYKIALDHEAYIFQNHDEQVQRLDGQLYNPRTNCCPCIYHGNGGPEAKAKFKEMLRQFNVTEKAEAPYIMTLDYEVVANEIIVTPFLSEPQCQWLIERSEVHGGWTSMKDDKFPAREIRLRELGLWDEYDRLWREKLSKVAEKHWQGYAYEGLRDAFTMKYTLDTQTSLALHTDGSMVTGSVKLNDDYEGAELIFPRQRFSNIDVPVGHCILFPSMVTHAHYVNELTAGEKYSLTMWTSRQPNDVAFS